MSPAPIRRTDTSGITFALPGSRLFRVIAVNQAGERIEQAIEATSTCDAINAMQDHLGYIPRYCRAVPAMGVRSGEFSHTEPVMNTEPAKLDAPTIAEKAQMQLESQRVAAFELAKSSAARRRGWALVAVFGVMFWAGVTGLARMYWGGL